MLMILDACQLGQTNLKKELETRIEREGWIGYQSCDKIVFLILDFESLLSYLILLINKKNNWFSLMLEHH